MAHAHSIAAPRNLVLRDRTPAKTPARSAAKPGFWARLLNALAESNQRRAEREIALYLRHANGKFTDEMERDIERRFLNPR